MTRQRQTRSLLSRVPDSSILRKEAHEFTRRAGGARPCRDRDPIDNAGAATKPAQDPGKQHNHARHDLSPPPAVTRPQETLTCVTRFFPTGSGTDRIISGGTKPCGKLTPSDTQCTEHTTGSKISITGIDTGTYTDRKGNNSNTASLAPRQRCNTAFRKARRNHSVSSKYVVTLLSNLGSSWDQIRELYLLDRRIVYDNIVT